MTHRSRNLKWVAVIPALLITVLSVSVVYGGLRWSGIDPEVSLDGHTLNVTAQWRSEDVCSVNGDVLIDIFHPADVTVNVVRESSATCEVDGETVELSTVTNTHVTDSNKVIVTGFVTSDDQMRARLLLTLDGKHVRTCNGQVNSLVSCKSFKLDKNSDHSGSHHAKEGRHEKKDSE